MYVGCSKVPLLNPGAVTTQLGSLTTAAPTACSTVVGPLISVADCEAVACNVNSPVTF